MSNTVTLSQEQLKTLLAAAVAEALASNKADNKALAVAGKSERSIKNEVQTAKAFKKAGFKDAIPHVNVKTFNRWLAEGMRPKEGEKSIKVKNLRLFHVSQCRPVTLDEKSDAFKKDQELIQKYNEARKAKPSGPTLVAG